VPSKCILEIIVLLLILPEVAEHSQMLFSFSLCYSMFANASPKFVVPKGMQFFIMGASQQFPLSRQENP